MGFSADLLMKEFEEYLEQELKHLDYAPMAFVTARDGRNVQVVLDQSQHLFKQAHQRVTTGQLNQAIEQIFEERKPPTPRGERIRVYYGTQVEVAPPTIVLFVNHPELINEQYKRFMINRFRELLPYWEVPIKLVLRGRAGRDPNEVVADTGRAAGPPRAGRGKAAKKTKKVKKPGRKPSPSAAAKKTPGRASPRGKRR
jgi:GTPase